MYLKDLAKNLTIILWMIVVIDILSKKIKYEKITARTIF